MLFEYCKAFRVTFGLYVSDYILFLLGTCDDGLDNAEDWLFELFDGEDKFVLVFIIGLLGEGKR